MSTNNITSAVELLQCIGDIGEDLIIEASAENVRSRFARRKRKSLATVLGGLAACLLLAVALSFPTLVMKPKFNNTGGNEENKWNDRTENSNGMSAYEYGPGTRVITDLGALAYRGYGENSVSFILTLNEPAENIRFSFVSSDITSASAVDSGIRVTVNGVGSPGGALPSEPGSYEITVDYSDYAASCTASGVDVPGIFTVSGFGRFITGAIRVEGVESPDSFYTDDFSDVRGKDTLY
ncbi:MAG: hypothetical protein SO533_01095 [Eubacteriales bacterium]|nr:hypothetical protein [Eubacteriales bacterium]